MPNMESIYMPTSIQQPDFDVIVIGGSYAGLSAALQLARARRRILIIDNGRRRNRFAQNSHGFLTQDGSTAAGIAAVGRAQLEEYPNVAWANETVVSAGGEKGRFEVEFPDGGVATAQRLVLATGVVDLLPPVVGLAERWGTSVFHCPYCHGYELGSGKIGVLSVGEISMHHALMLPDWGSVTFFLNGTFILDDAQRAALARRGVTLEETHVKRIIDVADVELVDGRLLPMKGLFVASRTHGMSKLAGQLGCAVEEGPTGDFVTTDTMKATTVSGVFSCGDMARPAGNVAFAVADGAMAGVAAHRSLIAELNY